MTDRQDAMYGWWQTDLHSAAGQFGDVRLVVSHLPTLWRGVTGMLFIPMAYAVQTTFSLPTPMPFLPTSPSHSSHLPPALLPAPYHLPPPHSSYPTLVPTPYLTCISPHPASLLLPAPYHHLLSPRLPLTCPALPSLPSSHPAALPTTFYLPPYLPSLYGLMPCCLRTLRHSGTPDGALANSAALYVTGYYDIVADGGWVDGRAPPLATWDVGVGLGCSDRRW